MLRPRLGEKQGREMKEWNYSHFHQLTQKPVQFDHVQLEVMNETVDIEKMTHQSHQAVT